MSAKKFELTREGELYFDYSKVGKNWTGLDWTTDLCGHEQLDDVQNGVLDLVYVLEQLHVSVLHTSQHLPREVLWIPTPATHNNSDSVSAHSCIFSVNHQW